MRFFVATLLIVLLAAFVSAEVDKRAVTTVTTLETITSCHSTVTNCPARSTYYANTTSTPYYANATNTTTPPIATATAGASSIQGSFVASALVGVVGILFFAM
ncbi:uncharacterized protein V1510DRAFT_423574 [Dipodascopsis tothii]|uniref:uncharacterized protein n=1 Tax=Dipodascopsis tothii TaxID=44089 RepID=UPI0034CEC97D